MKIKLEKVKENELKEVHKLQTKSFQFLLDKYQDFDTNPAMESITTIKKKFKQEFTTYYFIIYDNTKIGAIRIIYIKKENSVRISPMFIIPEFQNKGLGQQAVAKLEVLYKSIDNWTLDTIIQEKNLCDFYEKLGYVDTGKRKNIKEGMDIIYYYKDKKKNSL